MTKTVIASNGSLTCSDTLSCGVHVRGVSLNPISIMSRHTFYTSLFYCSQSQKSGKKE